MNENAHGKNFKLFFLHPTLYLCINESVELKFTIRIEVPLIIWNSDHKSVVRSVIHDSESNMADEIPICPDLRNISRIIPNWIRGGFRFFDH